jgi:AcrR family transcriptional regulator
MTAAQRAAPRRERARAATIEEIKQTALRLMHEQGTLNVRFTDIARAMDMTPPALYRYFADYDALLGALIADAYDALGDFVAQRRDAVPAGDLAGRWLAVAQAYREWARQEPQQFMLALGMPLPGYAAPEDGPTTEAAKRAMAQLAALFVEAIQLGCLRSPLVLDVGPAVTECAVIKSAEMGVTISPEHFQAMLHVWASLHGFVTLEIHGHFDWIGEEARDGLFLGQVRQIAHAAGMPVPAA